MARDLGVDRERLRHWVSFLAICGVLERALRQGVLGSYCLKGGVAMELRFAQRVRATRDLDLALEGDRASRLQTLSEVLRLGFDEFTFRVKAQTRDMEQAATIRVQVAIQHRTRSWQTIEVDLGPANAVRIDLVEPRVDGVMDLGIPVVSPVRCLGLADQVAQKLHACTGPAAAGRARDVLDILLIDLLGELDYPAAASAARRVFKERATHPFPPQFVMPDEWRPELEGLAAELGFPLLTAAAIERRFLECIRALQTAGFTAGTPAGP
ncbi:MAG: nucleotidyl transferase AbiEii/AbiGii toxin family protein [Acidobacteriota bacterium]